LQIYAFDDVVSSVVEALNNLLVMTLFNYVAIHHKRIVLSGLHDLLGDYADFKLFQRGFFGPKLHSETDKVGSVN